MVYKLEGVKAFQINGKIRFTLENVDVMVSPTARIVTAMDEKWGRRVVLKLGNKDNIQHEANIYEELIGMPGLPSIFGWSLTSPPFSYISMEPFTQNLYRYTQSTGSMCLGEACEIARKILSVLSSVHSKSIVHCDIKPQNIVFSVDGTGVGKLAIIDWGLAFKQGTKASQLRFLGTPAFMSVSCLSGNRLHPLDDVESLLYLAQFLSTAELPWGLPEVTEAEDCKGLVEKRVSWTPENSSLREFLVYARDRSSDRPLDYVYLDRLLFNAAREAAADTTAAVREWEVAHKSHPCE